MLEAMMSLRDEMQTMKKTAEEVEVDQIPSSASKPGTSKQTDTFHPNTALNTQPSEHTDDAMELDLYDPPLPPWFGDAHSEDGSDPNMVRIINQTSPNNPNKCVRLESKSMRTSENKMFGLNFYLSLHLHPLFT